MTQKFQGLREGETTRVLVKHDDGSPALWLEEDAEGRVWICDDGGSFPLTAAGLAELVELVAHWKRATA